MIDAVFTWVDGGDPAHAAARARHLGDGAQVDAGAHRYRDGDELRFALRALERHAPWVNKVFLVTNGQRPAWLADGALELVSHDQIFPDAAHLPTFNSCAIEMHLHRITGLAPRWLYFNDDFFLGAAVAPSDFMTASGQRLYVTPVVVPDHDPGLPEVWLASLRGVDRMLGGGPHRFTPHAPCLIESAVWEQLCARFPAEIARTSANRFRTTDDVAFAYTYTHARLAEHRPGDEIVEWSDLAIPLALPIAQLRGLLDQVRRFEPKFFCLQDEPGHDAMKAELVREFLTRMYPRKSRFER